MSTWSVTEAKARFSEVVRRCQKEPQTITLRGVPVAEVISVEEYYRLGGRALEQNGKSEKRRRRP